MVANYMATIDDLRKERQVNWDSSEVPGIVGGLTRLRRAIQAMGPINAIALIDELEREAHGIEERWEGMAGQYTQSRVDGHLALAQIVVAVVNDVYPQAL